MKKGIIRRDEIDKRGLSCTEAAPLKTFLIVSIQGKLRSSYSSSQGRSQASNTVETLPIIGFVHRIQNRDAFSATPSSRPRDEGRVRGNSAWRSKESGNGRVIGARQFPLAIALTSGFHFKEWISRRGRRVERKHKWWNFCRGERDEVEKWDKGGSTLSRVFLSRYRF